MKTFDASEMQVRLNECGEGEYVSRAVAEKLKQAVEFAYLLSENESIEHACGEALRFCLEN